MCYVGLVSFPFQAACSTCLMAHRVVDFSNSNKESVKDDGDDGCWLRILDCLACCTARSLQVDAGFDPILQHVATGKPSSQHQALV